MKKYLLVLILLFSFIVITGCNKTTISTEKYSWTITKKTKNPTTFTVADEYVMKEVRFSLDTKEYRAKSSSDLYKTSCKVDSTFTYITVTVKTTSEYLFTRATRVYVNEERVESKYITISEDRQTLTYKIEDPNWSPIV